jgi:hypothetical protein
MVVIDIYKRFLIYLSFTETSATVPKRLLFQYDLPTIEDFAILDRTGPS